MEQKHEDDRRETQNFFTDLRTKSEALSTLTSQHSEQIHILSKPKSTPWGTYLSIGAAGGATVLVASRVVEWLGKQFAIHQIPVALQNHDVNQKKPEDRIRRDPQGAIPLSRRTHLPNHKNTVCCIQTLLPFDTLGSYNGVTIDDMTPNQFRTTFQHIYQHQGYQTHSWNITNTQGEDLILRKPGQTILVHVHPSTENITESLIDVVHDATAFLPGSTAWIITNDYFTPTAKEQARILGVHCLDRNQLRGELQTYEFCIEEPKKQNDPIRA